uniref:Uncharacterized protein n=1 Tax=Phalansterium sp. PJK-2012 TaxID=1267188 RepID=T1QE08_9EUKA|nr:hypothetical protein [Phalansterium sp. PJK-2012]
MTLHYINFFYLFFIFMTQGVIVIVFNYNIKDEIERSYFRYMSRMSFLPTRFTIFEEKVTTFDKSTLQNQEEKNSNFNFRPLNNNEIEKLKFYQNYVIVFPVKLYSKIEQRFVELNFCLLIQWGDENSLLKRGIYVSVIRDGVVSPKFVLHSSFFYAGLPFKNIHYLDDYGTFFKIEDAHISTNKNHKAEGCSNLKNFMIGLDNDCDYFQLNSLDEAGKKKLIDSFFHLIETIIKGYFCMFIEPNKYDANKKELMCRKFNFTKMENYR